MARAAGWAILVLALAVAAGATTSPPPMPDNFIQYPKPSRDWRLFDIIPVYGRDDVTKQLKRCPRINATSVQLVSFPDSTAKGKVVDLNKDTDCGTWVMLCKYRVPPSDTRRSVAHLFVHPTESELWSCNRVQSPVNPQVPYNQSGSLVVQERWPKPYFFVTDNMNEDAGGNFVRICLQYDYAKRPVLDVAAVVLKDGADKQLALRLDTRVCPPGWVDAPFRRTDLNYEAGGRLIFLCIRIA
jgi:hypothetical protein